MVDWSALTKFINDLGNNPLPFLGAMAAIGTLSMAIVQTAKDMLPLRNWFQQWRLRQWLEGKAAKSSIAGGTLPLRVKPDVVKAEQDLILMSTAGDRNAFYDLPIEQMCGQMNAAAQAMLDYPEMHPDLLRCLAALAETADVNLVLTPPDANATVQPKPQNVVDARTRVIHQVQRSIDGFQISAGFRWKWILQITSFAVSFILTTAGLEIQSGGVFNSTANAFMLGLAGGFLAPVARDLMASIQNLRA